MDDTDDWFTVHELPGNTYQINELVPVLPTNSTLIDGGEEALLIDTGVGIGDLPTMVDRITDGDVQVLLTHSHWDHLGAAAKFENVSINDRERAPDGTVSYDFLPTDFSGRPQRFIDEWLGEGHDVPDSFDPDTYDIPPITGVDAIEPGASISVGDREVETIPLPGHTPGMLGLLDRSAGIVHVSDLLEPDRSGETEFEFLLQFEASDIGDCIDSLERLIDYREDDAFDTIAQTHGEPITSLSVLEDATEALEAVRAGDVSYETEDSQFGPQRKYLVGDFLVSRPGD